MKIEGTIGGTDMEKFGPDFETLHEHACTTAALFQHDGREPLTDRQLEALEFTVQSAFINLPNPYESSLFLRVANQRVLLSVIRRLRELEKLERERVKP